MAAMCEESSSGFQGISHLMPVHYTELLYSLIPPFFSLSAIALSKWEKDYFDYKAEQLCRAKGLDLRMSDFLGHIAKSSNALKNYMVNVSSGILSIAIAFHKWPSPYQYCAALSVLVVFFTFISNLDLENILPGTRRNIRIICPSEKTAKARIVRFPQLHLCAVIHSSTSHF